MKAALHTLAGRARAVLGRLGEQPPVHLLHVGKTGGTALKDALGPHLHTGARRIVLHDHTVKLRHIPVGEQVVFSVRDPVSRFESAFNSRKRKGRPRYNYPWSAAEARAFARFSSAEALARALAAVDAEEREAARSAMRAIAHVSSSYWDWFEDERYFAIRSPDILFIPFQETLTGDFAILARELGLSGASLPDDDRRAHRAPRVAAAGLSAPAAANLRAWYASDYRFIEICVRWRVAHGYATAAEAGV